MCLGLQVLSVARLACSSSGWSELRRLSNRVIKSRYFDNFILFIILCNCVTLALSSNRLDFGATRLGRALIVFDYLFVGIFTVEMIIKIIALGFVSHEGAYLRDGEGAGRVSLVRLSTHRGCGSH